MSSITKKEANDINYKKLHKKLDNAGSVVDISEIMAEFGRQTVIESGYIPPWLCLECDYYDIIDNGDIYEPHTYGCVYGWDGVKYGNDGFNPEKCKKLQEIWADVWIEEMSDRCLLEAIDEIKQKAENGILVKYPGYEWGDYDDDILYGSEALEHLDYEEYIAEAKKRGL